MKLLWVAIGCVTLGLGILGIFLPLLPTTPFFLLTVICFSKGSEKFHSWFTATKMYTDYIESYRPNRYVPLRKKIEIIASVTLLICISAYFVRNLIVWSILGMVFIGHIIYFSFFIKSKNDD